MNRMFRSLQLAATDWKFSSRLLSIFGSIRSYCTFSKGTAVLGKLAYPFQQRSGMHVSIHEQDIAKGQEFLQEGLRVYRGCFKRYFTEVRSGSDAFLNRSAGESRWGGLIDGIVIFNHQAFKLHSGLRATHIHHCWKSNVHQNYRIWGG